MISLPVAPAMTDEVREQVANAATFQARGPVWAARSVRIAAPPAEVLEEVTGAHHLVVVRGAATAVIGVGPTARASEVERC